MAVRVGVCAAALAGVSLTGVAYGQTYEVGQYLGNLNEAGRMAYHAAGTSAQQAYHARYTPGAAYLRQPNGVRVSGTALATIGGRPVPLTLTSRVPYPSLVKAVRGAAMLTPVGGLVTVMGFAAMQMWMDDAKLSWNADANSELPASKLTWRHSGYWTSIWGPPGTQYSSAQAACASQGGWEPGRYVATIGPTGKTADCSVSGAGGSLGTVHFVGSAFEEPVPITWPEVEAALQAAAEAKADASYWKGVVEGLLQRGGSIPANEIVDQTVTGPASQPGQTTTRQLSNGDTSTTTTTHNYTYNGNSVTHNTTTVTTITNINNEIVTEETETTDNAAPDTKPDTDFCERNPGVLACAETDRPDGEIPREDRQITYAEESLFGTGGCPADLHASIATLGQTVKIWDWQKTCDLALPLRAIVVALATFAAFLIVMPGETRV